MAQWSSLLCSCSAERFGRQFVSVPTRAPWNCRILKTKRIQEQNVFSPTVREVSPGAPEIRGGYMYANDQPGLGIDIDEKLAPRFPYKSPRGSRGNGRRLDGTIVRP
jgi:hypothetical protein